MVGIRADEYFHFNVLAHLNQKSVPHWRDIATGNERIGPSDAAVVIVEFGDFQCPFCRSASTDLAAIRSEFPSTVAIVFENYPLPNHKFAVPAAQAAECAAAQGDFEKYYNRLFSTGPFNAEPDWVAVAGEVGVKDLGSFKACLSDKVVAGRLMGEVSVGARLGVKGTPMFLINGREVDGYPGPGKLMEMVRAALKTKVL